MPLHDWTRVEAGIFHPFHHGWISTLCDTLNAGLLPTDFYALPEEVAAGIGPDVLALQEHQPDRGEITNGAVATKTRPQTRFMVETEAAFYRRKKSAIAVRHVNGDHIAAMIEIVSPGNKATRSAFRAFVEKACELLEHRIHLLIIDPFPPGKRDPNGVHAAIWEEVEDDPFQIPTEKPLTLVAYECDFTTRAHIEPVAVGDTLPEMPLFLAANYCIMVPLEATYQADFAVQPRRWQKVLEGHDTVSS